MAGGATGKAVAQAVNPAVEEAYWREHFTAHAVPQQVVYLPGYSYEDYAPAFQLGYMAREKYYGLAFDAIDPALQRDWLLLKGASRLSHEQARAVAREAWNRIA